MKKYPNLVCYKCGNKYGEATEESTFHIGTCDVCGKEASVTEPRDYNYPNFPGHEELPSGDYYDYF